MVTLVAMATGAGVVAGAGTGVGAGAMTEGGVAVALVSCCGGTICAAEVDVKNFVVTVAVVMVVVVTGMGTGATEDGFVGLEPSGGKAS